MKKLISKLFPFLFRRKKTVKSIPASFNNANQDALSRYWRDEHEKVLNKLPKWTKEEIEQELIDHVMEDINPNEN